MTYSQIVDIINQNIKQNGREEITGNILNSVLKLMLDYVQDGYITLNDILQIIAENESIGIIGSINPSTDTSSLPNGFYFAETSGTYTNANNIVVEEGYYTILEKTDSGWKVASSVKLPSYDDTDLQNRITQVEQTNTSFQNSVNQRISDLETEQDDFIENFSVEVDQEFDENSENAIANKAVTYLANSLKGFIEKRESEDFELINNSSLVSGKFLFKNNTVETATSFPNVMVLHNLDVTNFISMKYSVYRRGNANSRATLLGVKTNNEIVQIVEGLPTADNENIVDGKFDLTDYKFISWECLDTHTDAYLKLYYQDGYKYTVVKDFFNPNSDEFLGGSNDDLTTVDNVLNLIQTGSALINTGIIRVDNSFQNITGFNAVHNLDVSVYNSAKFEIRVKRTMTTPLSGMASVFNAILEDGKIINLIPYVQGNDGDLTEVLEVEVPKGTKYISVSTKSGVTGGFYIKLLESYKTPYNSYYDAWVNWVGKNNKGSNDVTSKTYLSFDKPQLLKLDLIGSLPTDISDNRTPTDLVMKVYHNENTLFVSNVQLSIQGRSSIEHPKKGYTLDLYNSNMESLDVKWGDWYAKDSWHLKAFWGDELLTRDVSAGRFYEKMYKSLPFPYSYNSPLEPNPNEQNSKYLYRDVAKFFTDGIPCEVYLNGSFFGLYIWRMKKDRQNYRTVKANKNHIHLEPNDGNTFIHQWSPSKWELRNPELPGYVPGGDITDIDINNAMTRFTTWVNNCYNNTVSFNETHQNYIELNNWIDYLLFCEVFYSIDGLINNYQLVSFDANIFYVYPYDLDYILGYRLAVAPNDNYVGRVINVFDNRLLKVINRDKMNEIKARYKYLRDNKIFDTTNFVEIFSEIPSIFGEKRLKENFNKWKSFQYNNFSQHRSSIQYLANVFQNRINYLDGVFEY